MTRIATLSMVAISLIFGMASAPVNFRAAAKDELRVCADPNNLPFSNKSREGFENRIAELVARDLNRPLTYVFAIQRDNFVKKTLNAGLCDLVIGLPVGFDQADLTRPYYQSEYAFVYRADRKLGLHSMRDKRLSELKIGVHLIGDADTPPVAALTRQGIVRNVVGFMMYGDTSRPNPPARLIEAVENGSVDVAAVWGPLGGYFAKHSPVPLEVSPITDVSGFSPLKFRYQMAMGVRHGDDLLKSQLNQIITSRNAEIRNILISYGVPVTASAKYERPNNP
jgi:quinoprotein dehydrogenase-associated probable ABC transporter substrate-binding protein